mgnify:CR=1 FL=1
MPKAAQKKKPVKRTKPKKPAAGHEIAKPFRNIKNISHTIFTSVSDFPVHWRKIQPSTWRLLALLAGIAAALALVVWICTKVYAWAELKVSEGAGDAPQIETQAGLQPQPPDASAQEEEEKDPVRAVPDRPVRLRSTGDYVPGIYIDKNYK